VPSFTTPIHEHGTPGQKNYPHPLGRGERDAFVGTPRSSSKQSLLEPYGEHGTVVAAAQQQLTRLMAGDGNEHMVVYQPGEHPFYFTSGNPAFVEMPTPTFAKEMRDNPPIFTAHTHPTASAPSLADIRVQVNTKTAKQLIFGPGGEWYEIEITDFDTAKKVIGQGRTRATPWEEGKKGKFATEFDRLKKGVMTEAAKNTDAWAAKTYGWTIAPNPFLSPKESPRVVGSKTMKKAGAEGFIMEDGSWIGRKEAGKLHPEIRQYHLQQFVELSPRIWLKLREKHTWFKFRHDRKTGPYATSTH